MQVKFDISNYLQNFGQVMAFFSLIFVGVLILVPTQKLLQGCIDFIESLQKDISL